MFEFPPFRLDPVNECLWHRQNGTQDRRIHLPPNAFAVLRYLVERAGRLVTEKELLASVWPKTRVEPQAVKKQIFAIRKTLGDDAGAPRYIETLQRRGYQFIAPIVAEVSAQSEVPMLHNLPEALTSFIGRETEIAELKELLLTGTRLLILSGAGGCGKTRLAAQVAADLLHAYPDGIWWVELATLADAGFVPQAVAKVFGLKEQTGKNLANTIADHLASKRALLVLDNAEHLLAACASLSDLALRRCSQLAILATSRERLGISGELTYRVPSLSLPDPEQEMTPERILSCESVRLFIERVRLQRPHFTLSAENASAVAVICQRLDGIPLAIELAASRVRSMSVEELSQRLNQRFGLLVGGSRSALPRHRTLRSLIDWSFDLLSDAEKSLLCRVSVFSGGWTLEAAEHICADEGVDGNEVLDLLGSLVDKSLLVAEEHAGATRYGLLETVRQYARDWLRERRAEPKWNHRHLAFYLALAETAEPKLNGSEEQVWLDRLEVEHANLQSALAWSCTPEGDAVGGLRLAGALCRFWLVRGYLGAGRGWYSMVLAAAPREQRSAARAKALRKAGELTEQQGDYPAAETLLNESLAIYRELGDQNGTAPVLMVLGIVACNRGAYPAARTLYAESLAIYRELNYRRGVGNALLGLGTAALEQGDYLAARELHEEALAILLEIGDRYVAARTMVNLGILAYEVGDCAAARTWDEKCLAIGRELGSWWNIAMSLNNLGMVASAEGDHLAARTLCQEGLSIMRDQGDRWGMAWSLEAIAVTHSPSLPSLAARIWGRAELLREEIGSPLPPPWRPRYERQIAAARRVADDGAVFDRSWQEGRTLALNEVVALALEKS